MKKFLGYLKTAYRFVKSADEAGVIDEIRKAVEDRNITVKEMFLIGSRICGMNGINLDAKGIDLNKLLK